MGVHLFCSNLCVYVPVFHFFLKYDILYSQANLMRLRLILGDQLSETVSSLQNIDKINDIILICEVHS